MSLQIADIIETATEKARGLLKNIILMPATESSGIVHS